MSVCLFDFSALTHASGVAKGPLIIGGQDYESSTGLRDQTFPRIDHSVLLISSFTANCEPGILIEHNSRWLSLFKSAHSDVLQGYLPPMFQRLGGFLLRQRSWL